MSSSIQFYAPEIADTGLLPEAESIHAIRVLRKEIGDYITVVDGKGNRYQCEIIGKNPKATQVSIIEKEEIPPHWGVKITLAVAPTKNIDRIEWLLEKGVETGIDEVVILKCEHSERKSVKIDRLERVMISAMKQSLKATLPHISGDIVDFKEFISAPRKGEKYIGYCDSDTRRQELVKLYTPGHDVTLVIGPEGDFSSEEIELAIQHGFIPVTFGESRFRTESAALFAVSAIHVINQMSK